MPHDDEDLSEQLETFHDFDSLLAFLTETYDSLANSIAEQRAKDPLDDRYPLGGFGIDLTNQWGKKIMVGVPLGYRAYEKWTAAGLKRSRAAEIKRLTLELGATRRSVLKGINALNAGVQKPSTLQETLDGAQRITKLEARLEKLTRKRTDTE